MNNLEPVLLLPEKKWLVANPEVSIVVPALNEEITIGEFVDWCWEGIARAGVRAEILIIDSSDDHTAKIALEKGAKVLKTSKRGLGQAYLDALGFISGKFLILGDCDLTYDFREITPFIEQYKNGSEFVMGSRFKGTIEKGAMPRLHQYFGTPITTWILNTIYSSKYSDIHCGMRGLTLEAFKRLELTSRGWEYASEMVLKATRLKLQTSEVPVSFYKDREGRLSHHKRSGFLSPWIAGWINLKVMFVFSADSFLLWPSIIMFILGNIISATSLVDSIIGGNLGFGSSTMLLGLTLVAISTLTFQAGITTRLLHNLRQGFEIQLLKTFTYNRGMLTSGILFLAGLIAEFVFLNEFIDSRGSEASIKLAVIGLELLLISGIVFSNTLVLELFRRKRLH